MKELIFETSGTDKVALITYAIVNKYTLVFHYNGVNVKDPNRPDYTKKGIRYKIQPVALGKSIKSNRMMLRGWQTQGTTNTKQNKWKSFILDEIAGNINVWDGAYGFAWDPFTKPPFNADEDGAFNNSGDKGMSGEGKVVNDEMRADIKKAEEAVASGFTLVMDENQDGGPNLKYLLPKIDEPEEPEVEVDDTEEKPEISIRDKYKAKADKKKANDLKYRLLKKNKKDADALINVDAEINNDDDVTLKDDPDAIENLVIPIKAGNPNNQKPDGLPPEEPVTPEDGTEPEEPLQESSGWLNWLEKIL